MWYFLCAAKVHKKLRKLSPTSARTPQYERHSAYGDLLSTPICYLPVLPSIQFMRYVALPWCPFYPTATARTRHLYLYGQCSWHVVCQYQYIAHPPNHRMLAPSPCEQDDIPADFPLIKTLKGLSIIKTPHNVFAFGNCYFLQSN
jgi:hypothetical protein